MELGRSFYKRPRRGRGSEVASTGELATTAMMAHSGDGMARAGADGMARVGARRQGRKAPNLSGEHVNGEAMERAAVGGDRVDSRSRAGERELTGWALLSGGEGDREGEGALTSGAGLTAAWHKRGRGRWAMLGFGRGDERALERGGLGRNRTSQGGGGRFPFSFSISNSISISFLFSF
jgi:hypothetical protein